MENKMRLIDANALLETGSGIKVIVPVNCHPYEAIRIQGNAFRKAVKEAPTVDAVPVVHAKWDEWWPGDCALIMTGEEMLYQCSACTAKYSDIEGKRYCPHCGAKMDGDGNA